MPRVVLIHPQIPPNTGNIARTCAATGTELHLVGPLGFEISDRYLKRAGLDYWPYVKLHYHQNLEAFKTMHQQRGGRWLGFSVNGSLTIQTSNSKTVTGCYLVAKPRVCPQPFCLLAMLPFIFP